MRSVMGARHRMAIVAGARSRSNRGHSKSCVRLSSPRFRPAVHWLQMEELDYQNADDARRDAGLLRKLFGPSKAEVWQRLATQIDARFEHGGWWRGDKLTAKVGEWTITLDTYTEHRGETSSAYTRLRAPYVNRDGFRFRISRRHLFTCIGELFGAQDIEIGEPKFDDDFVIKANDESKVRTLFAEPRLRELLS